MKNPVFSFLALVILVVLCIIIEPIWIQAQKNILNNKKTNDSKVVQTNRDMPGGVSYHM